VINGFSVLAVKGFVAIFV